MVFPKYLSSLNLACPNTKSWKNMWNQNINDGKLNSCNRICCIIALFLNARFFLPWLFLHSLSGKICDIPQNLETTTRKAAKPRISTIATQNRILACSIIIPAILFRSIMYKRGNNVPKSANVAADCISHWFWNRSQFLHHNALKWVNFWERRQNHNN